MSERTTFTVPELAEFWHCSTDIIYDLLKRGELKGFKLGKSWRISDEARKQYEQLPAPTPKLHGSGKRVLTIT